MPSPFLALAILPRSKRVRLEISSAVKLAIAVQSQNVLVQSELDCAFINGVQFIPRGPRVAAKRLSWTSLGRATAKECASKTSPRNQPKPPQQNGKHEIIERLNFGPR